MRGQGIEKDGKKGDLIVEATITVPEDLSEEQRQKMKEFAEAGGLKYYCSLLLVTAPAARMVS